MKILLLTSFIFALATLCFGQKTVADLKPIHAEALEQFLSKNKNYQFLSENVIDDENLKYIHQDFGKFFKPYYSVADFNHDKIEDFALILQRKGKRTFIEGNGEGYEYDYPLAVIIFNGNKKGTFIKAFIEDIEAPLLCLLNVDGKKKKQIYFGIYASDADTKIFTPVGKGYIIEYPKEP